MTNFSPHISYVIYVTNMRYVLHLVSMCWHLLQMWRHPEEGLWALSVNRTKLHFEFGSNQKTSMACINLCATFKEFVGDVKQWEASVRSLSIYCAPKLCFEGRLKNKLFHILGEQEIGVACHCVGICHRRAAMRTVRQPSVKPTHQHFLD